MMITITCAKCSTDGSISITDASYEGPYKCWKCKELYTIKLESNQLKSCEPLSQEEFEKHQEIEAMRDKFRQG